MRPFPFEQVRLTSIYSMGDGAVHWQCQVIPPAECIEVNCTSSSLRGVIITLIGLLYALVPAVSRAYWVVAALATEVYLIMYVLLFVAAGNLRRRAPKHERGYRAPALATICVVGILASIAACVIGLLPPSQLGHISTPPYLLALLAATLLVGVLPPLLLHKLRRPTWSTTR